MYALFNVIKLLDKLSSTSDGILNNLRYDYFKC